MDLDISLVLKQTSDAQHNVDHSCLKYFLSKLKTKFRIKKQGDTVGSISFYIIQQIY